MAIQDDLDVLYACPLSEFLDRRKALAAALRKAGSKDLAVMVANAGKPAPAAWAVNQLARRYPGEMTALMNAGAALRAQLRASFAGIAGANAKAMASAQAEQRDAVTALVPLARALLQAGGVSASAVVLDRVATTLTAISTTGTWGDCAPLRLTKELEPPGIEALAALVADVMPEPAPAAATIAPSPAAPRSTELAEEPPEQEHTARRAAAQAAERLAAAEAALQAAAAAEQQARAALQSAQAAVAHLRETREQRQAHASEAARLAAQLEQAAADARNKAQAAAAAARKADAEVEDSVRAERAGRDELAAAQQAVTRAAGERAAAEAALLRMRKPSP